MAISCRQHCICQPGTARKCTQRLDIPGSTAFVPSVVGLIIQSNSNPLLSCDYHSNKNKYLLLDSECLVMQNIKHCSSIINLTSKPLPQHPDTPLTLWIYNHRTKIINSCFQQAIFCVRNKI